MLASIEPRQFAFPAIYKSDFIVSTRLERMVYEASDASGSGIVHRLHAICERNGLFFVTRFRGGALGHRKACVRGACSSKSRRGISMCRGRKDLNEHLMDIEPS